MEDIESKRRKASSLKCSARAPSKKVKQNPQNSSSATPKRAKKSFEISSDISLKLAKRVMSNKEAKGENVVFSPLSINTILAWVACGSIGKTLDKFLSYFGSPSLEDLNSYFSRVIPVVLADGGSNDGPTLLSANGCFLQKGMPLKQSFKELVERVYNAATYLVDFENKAAGVVDSVNEWVEKNTKGLIKNVLSPGDVNCFTCLILVNCLYFKGTWLDEFNVVNTRKHKFHLLNGDTVEVPFMCSSSSTHLIKVFDGFKVGGLPYKAGRANGLNFTMYIFLPDAKDGQGDILRSRMKASLVPNALKQGD